jgi:EAL domain-containing protein (putative c-di-GMP-specific phosphodiesterase class I)/FixJ family two-component response regulator
VRDAEDARDGSTAATPARGRLVVLDDDEGVGATIGLIAESAGFDVAVTSAFAAFWEELASGDASHVILDLNMPDIDGIEVVQRLAERDFGGFLIISSGLGRRVLEAAERSATEHGLRFVGVLPKPFGAEDLRRLLATAPGPRPHRPAAADGPDVTVDMLRWALDGRDLTVAFQPKVTCATGGVIGFEALARWWHPSARNVPPEVFVSLAEREGLIDTLTDQVFDEALRWLHASFPDDETQLALNLSALSLGDLGLADRIERACNAWSVDPRRIVLELTETASTGDQVAALDVLTRLRIKGMALSIDDFGTGHSTLVQLARLPFSELKIDRQFVMHAASSEESRTIIRAMVGLGRALGLVVTAEGVEDEATYAYLGEVGCDAAQGYVIGRPMEGEVVAAWLREWGGGRPALRT